MVTATTPKTEMFWNTLQEPRCPAYLPNSYMLLRFFPTEQAKNAQILLCFSLRTQRAQR
jgi:hypothetical protein